MAKTSYPGIDYSGIGATCNRDSDTGIRYGIIPAGACTEWIWESFEPDYGTPHCSECGNDVKECKGEYARYKRPHRHECDDYVCHSCKIVFGSESAFPEECVGNVLDDGTYQASIDDSGDVWIFKSPFYTFAQFCSPCAPGACYLLNPCESGARAYCFDSEWFQTNDAIRQLPYPVYSVETGELLEWPSDYFDGILFPECDE